MKNLHLILVLFSIASMFTSFGVYDVDATKDDNNGKNGCDKSNGNSKACEKNKNSDVSSGGTGLCDVLADPTGDCDGDGLTNSEDYCPDVSIGTNKQRATDWDGDTISNGVDADPCDPTVT